MMYTGKGGKQYELIPNRIAGGGEGEIYGIIDAEYLVAKMYKPGKVSSDKELKLIRMVDFPPDRSILAQIAWPQDILYDAQGNLAGFVMLKLVTNEDLNIIYEPGASSKYPEMLWESKIVIAENLCAVLHGVHEAGHVCGDFNPKNISVDPDSGLIVFLDTDSYHIQDGMKTYRCEVAIPEYLAGEIQAKMRGGNTLATAALPTFTRESDHFALAVHIFQLLMNGAHPFACALVPGRQASVVAPQPSDNIVRGNFPFMQNIPGIKIPVYAPNINILPPEIQELFKRAFIDGHFTPGSRPSTVEWHGALRRLRGKLMQCPQSPHHQYYSALPTCPWCQTNANVYTMLSLGRRSSGGYVSDSKPQEESAYKGIPGSGGSAGGAGSAGSAGGAWSAGGSSGSGPAWSAGGAGSAGSAGGAGSAGLTGGAGSAGSAGNATKKLRRKNRLVRTLLIILLIALLPIVGYLAYDYFIDKPDDGGSTDKKIDIPEFVGLIYTELIADEEYSEMFIFILEVEQYNDETPQGVVLMQDPPAGILEDSDQASLIEIRLVVSLGGYIETPPTEPPEPGTTYTSPEPEPPQTIHGITVGVYNSEYGTANASSTDAELGDLINLTATVNDGFIFDRWEAVSGDALIVSETSQETSFLMPNSNVTIIAHFRPEHVLVHTISMSANNTSQGSASADRATAESGARVNISASPNPGYEFDRWEVISGGVTVSNRNNSSTSFVMADSDVSIRAHFKTAAPNVYTVTTDVNNSSHGTAGANPSSAAQGATVTLSASARNGYVFDYWEVVSGGITLSNRNSPNATFTMPNRNVHVRAHYWAVLFNITTIVENSDSGTISVYPTSAAQGTVVTLNATARPGYVFDYWEVVSGRVTLSSWSSPNATFTMPDQEVFIKAHFRAMLFTITTSVNNNAQGTVSISHLAANQGTLVSLSALPNTGYAFSHWEILSGGITLSDVNSPTATFTMTGRDVSVRAHFRTNTFSVTVNVNNTAQGSASANLTTAAENARIDLQAIPRTGFEFVRWEVISGNVTISNPTSANTAWFVMPARNVTVRAEFRVAQYPITVSINNFSYGDASADFEKASQGALVYLYAVAYGANTFDYWEVVSGNITIYNSTSATNAWFTMPGNPVEIRAVFREAPPPPQYDITVYVKDGEGGTASANYTRAAQGTTIEISVTALDGYIFDYAQIESEGIVTGIDDKTFIMPNKDVRVIVYFARIIMN